jgi:hypothetical protein
MQSPEYINLMETAWKMQAISIISKFHRLKILSKLIQTM